MKPSINKVHLTLAFLVNFLIVSKLIHFSWTGNDKAILVVIFYYFMQIIANLLAWVILDYQKQEAARIYKIITTILVVLIIPVILLSVLH